MNIEEVIKLVDKIEKDEYIDCSNNLCDGDQYIRILSALKKNVELHHKVDELNANNIHLIADKEYFEKRLKHLLKSKTISNYDELSTGEYIKNINELDSFMETCNKMICCSLIKDATVNRVDDFKVERKKNDIKLVYDPIEKPIALQITVVENDKNEVCPICGLELGQYPALSRKDNKTKICSNCGMLEALEAFNNSLKADDKNE